MSVYHPPPESTCSAADFFLDVRKSLSSSETEFLIFCPKKQLYKVDDSSLNTNHSAHNRGFIFDKHHI